MYFIMVANFLLVLWFTYSCVPACARFTIIGHGQPLVFQDEEASRTIEWLLYFDGPRNTRNGPPSQRRLFKRFASADGVAGRK